jgi:phosphate transport system protein
MSELQKRLEKLVLRIDHMGMRVEQAMIDAHRSVLEGNELAAREVEAGDAVIDREEVEIEQECIRLLALYQPAATDLRTICTVIKMNNDLERIADLAVHIARRARHVVADGIDLTTNSGFDELAQVTMDVLGKTVRMLTATDTSAAKAVIHSDSQVNHTYKSFVRTVVDQHRETVGGTEVALTLITLARAFERVGDLCTNIAEDVIFLRTGDIVRHQSAFGEADAAT